MNPCDCRLTRKTAMACERTPRGRLVWKPDQNVEGVPVGEMQVVDLDGKRQMLTFDDGAERCSEGLARDHARIRHLDFQMV